MGRKLRHDGGRPAGVGTIAWVHRSLVLMGLVGAFAAIGTALPSRLLPAASATAYSCTPISTSVSWANRDDDGDGVCNGVDVCPYVFNPSQDQSACAMRAVTAPARPEDVTAPHRTYSGATVTLAGIAQYGGTQYRWDFGDGTTPTPWTGIANVYSLSAQHVYVGSVGRRFTATLSVGSGGTLGAPATVATAPYPVQIARGSDLTDPAQLDVRAAMAIDRGLWYLHTQLARSYFADGANGYSEPYVAGSSLATTCVTVDALERLGITPNLDAASNPYVDDVRRGLNYILYNAQTVTLTPTSYGNPVAGSGDPYGIRIGNDATGPNGACALALADSGTPGRLALTGPANVLGRPYRQIVQDMVDYFAWSIPPSQGGWGYSAQQGGFVDDDTTWWPTRVLDVARGRMGSTVPGFVGGALTTWLNSDQSRTTDANAGGFELAPGWFPPADRATGQAIRDLEFLGRGTADATVQGALGFLYRNWNGVPGDQWRINLGWMDAMARTSDALSSLGVTRLPEVNSVTGQATGSSFDWYDTLAGQSQQGYGSYLVSVQGSNGSWIDSQGGVISDDSVGGDQVSMTAFGLETLASRSDGPVRAAICNPDTAWDINAPITVDGSCSSGPRGETLTYRWTVNGAPRPDGFSKLSLTAPAYTQYANGSPTGTTETVCLAVSDTTGDHAARCTDLIVRPGPSCPVPSVGGPYRVAAGQTVTLDASGSSDRDGDPLTYAWDVHNNGQFTDGTGRQLQFTFAMPGTYVVGVQVTDHPELATPPYNPSSMPGAVPPNGDCTTTAYTTVTVGSPAPSADAGGPYYATPNSSVSLDASRSTASGGQALTFNWDLTGAGMYSDATGATPTFTVGSVPVGTSLPVCVRASVTDAAYDVACARVLVVSALDTTPPAITVSNVPSGANGWSNTSPVTESVVASDGGTGLAAPPACTLDGSAVSLLTSGDGTTWTFPVSGDGSHAVLCTVGDRTGNTGMASDTVKIDSASPSLMLSHTVDGQNGWNTGSAVTESVLVTDAGSGVTPSSLVCAIDGNSVAALTSAGDGATWTFPVSADGTHAVSCTAQDAAGNVSSGTDTVKIDTTAPVTSDDAPAGVLDHDVTVHLSASDATSGVAATLYTLDGGTQQTYDPTAGIAVPLSLGDGAHTITYWSTDAAGNAETAHTATVHLGQLDHFAVAVAGPVYRATAATVTVSAEDAAGEIITSYAGTPSWSDSAGLLPSGSAPAGFLDGVSSTPVSLTGTAASDVLSVTDGSVTSASAAFAITNPPAAFHVAIAPGAQTGSPFAVTVTAVDATGQVVPYAGSPSWSDTAGQLTGAPAAFAGGTSTTPVTFAQPVRGDTITVSDTAAGLSGASAAFPVIGPVSHYGVSMNGTLTAGAPSRIHITALDGAGNTVTGYVPAPGAVSWSDSAGQLSGGPGPFVRGVTTDAVTFVSPVHLDTLRVSGPGGTITGSAAFRVLGPVTHYALVVSRPMTVNTPFTVKISALDAIGDVVTTDTGTPSDLTWSDAAGKISGAPAAFAKGVSMNAVTLAAPVHLDRLNVSSNAGAVNGLTTLTVLGPFSAYRLVVDGAIAAGTPFTVRITAVDAASNVLTGYAPLAGTPTWSDGTGTLSGSPAAFVTGVSTNTVTLPEPVHHDVLTVTGPGGASGTTAVNAVGPTTHFGVSVAWPALAGAPFTARITALDAAGNTTPSYAAPAGGTTWSDSADKVSGVPAGFVNGVSTNTVTVAVPLHHDTLTASAGALTGSAVFDVLGPLARFRITVPSPVSAGSAFPVTIVAQDALGSTLTNYSGTPTLSDGAGAMTSGPTAAFVRGSLATQVTLVAGASPLTSDTLTATDGAVTTTTGAFPVS